MLYFIARGIFLHMTIQSNELTAFWSNLGSILQSADRWPEGHPDGKVPRYMSFGISSLQIPLEWHIEQNIDEILLERLNELRGHDVNPEDCRKYVDDFITNYRLGLEDLVKRLQPRDFNYRIPDAPERPHQQTDAIPSWKQQSLTAIEEQLRRDVGEHTQTFTALREEVKKVLTDQVYRVMLQEPGHIQKAHLFVEQLVQNLKENQDRAKSQENQLEQQWKAIEFPPLEDALKGWFTKRKIEKLVADYHQALEQVAQLKLKAQLYHLASVLLGNLILHAEKLLDELKAFDRHLDQVMLRLRFDLDQLARSQAFSADAFATVLREEEVEFAFTERRPTVSLESLANAWYNAPISYASEQVEESLFSMRTLLGWRSRSPEELISWLKAEVRKSYEDLMTQNIDSIIHGLWQQVERSGSDAQKKLQQRLQEFLDKARPLWRVEVDPGRHLQYLMIIGIPERRDVAIPFIRSLIEDSVIVTGGSVSGILSLSSLCFHMGAVCYPCFAHRSSCPSLCP